MSSKYRQLTINDVGPEAWAAFEEAKVAYNIHKSAVEKANALCTAALPPLPSGVAYVFSHSFGKLSVFMGEPKATKPPKANGSLSDWIAQQVGNGRAV